MFNFFKKDKVSEDLSSLKPDVKSFDLPWQPTLLQQIFPKGDTSRLHFHHLTDLVRIYGTVGFVFACVDYIANCLRLIDVEVIDRKNNVVVTDSSLYKLLKNPNPNLGFHSFMEAFAVSCLLTGNFYAEIVRIRNNQVVGLYPLQPHRVRIKNENTYVYMANDTETELDAHDVLHIKTYNPMDDFYGFSALIPTERDVDILNNINQFLDKYFENGALVSGVLESDRRIPDEVFKRLKTLWKQLYTGVKNAFKVPILEGGLKFKPLSSHISDTQAIDIDERIIEKILAVFHVPPELLGLRTQKANVLSNVRKAFWQDTIMPFAGRLEEALNTPAIRQKIAPQSEQNLFVKFNYDNVPALREDRLTLARVTAIVADRGIMTRNEIRERFFKLPPVEGGDEFLLPLNMTQVDSDRKPENEGLGRPPATEATSDNKYIKSQSHMSEEDWLLFHNLMEINIADKVSRVYSKQRDTLKTRISSELAILMLLSPEDRYKKISQLVDQTQKLMQVELEDEFTNVADRLYYDTLREIEPATAILANPPSELYKFVSEWAELLSKLVNETTKEDIVKVLTNALNETMEIDIALNKVFNKLTDVVDGVRLERICRTETTYFLNGIRHMVFSKYGYKYKVWWTCSDERVRECHQPLHGVKMSINDCFEVCGEKARWPADILLSPANRINCRCWLTFVKD